MTHGTLRLGPYRLIRLLAQGGMGEVYLATLSREGGFEKRVALKRILPALACQPAFVELFEREARLAATLNHRNIVQVFDFGHQGDEIWLAMEYVHGVDLQSVLERGRAHNVPLPWGLVLELGLACCRGLDHMHRAKDHRGRPLGLVHQDISPQNVLLSFDGDVKLTDFGLAAAQAQEQSDTGLWGGKIAYMSPEQAAGQAVDGRSDLFSLATILYEAFSGQRAFFDQDGRDAVLRRVRQAEPRLPLAVAAPALPGPLRHVLERAMARAVTDRYPEARHLEHALREAAQQAGLIPGDPPLGSWLRAFLAESVAGLGIRSVTSPPPISESTEAAAMPIGPVNTQPASGVPIAEPSAAPPAAPAPPTRVSPPLHAASEIRPPTGGKGRSWAGATLLLLGGITLGLWLGWPSTVPDPLPVPPLAATASPRSPHAAPTLASGTGLPPLLPPTAGAATGTAAVLHIAPQVISRPDPEPQGSVAPAAVAPPPQPVRAQPSKPAMAVPAARSPRPDGVREVRLQAGAAQIATNQGPLRGWHALSSAGMLYEISGGSGPAVRIRLKSEGVLIQANLDAHPWGRVRLDDRLLGTTPLAAIPLLAGSHHFEIKGQSGETTQLDLEIKP